MGNLTNDQKEFLELMRRAGWTNAETARRLKVNRSAITLIVSGRNNPTRTLPFLRFLVEKFLAEKKLGESSEQIQETSVEESDPSSSIAGAVSPGRIVSTKKPGSRMLYNLTGGGGVELRDQGIHTKLEDLRNLNPEKFKVLEELIETYHSVTVSKYPSQKKSKKKPV